MLGVLRSDQPWAQVTQYFIDSIYDNVYIVNTDGELVREITQQYWRSAMLLDFNTQSPIAELIPYLEIEMARAAGSINYNVAELSLLPRVDADKDQAGNILRTYVVDKISNIDNIGSGLIMAGGFGRRLGHLVSAVPKPMLEVSGKPILEYLIDNLVSSGIKEIYISVHHLSHVIMEYFGDGSAFGCRIQYLEETKPLGTAGCLSLLPKNVKFPIVMVNGDIMTDLNFAKLLNYHNNVGSDLTVAIRPHHVTVPYGVLEYQGMSVTGIQEKPKFTYFINTAVYVVTDTIIKQISANVAIDMPTIIRSVLPMGSRLVAFPLLEEWSDIGSPATLDRARKTFASVPESSASDNNIL